MLNRVVGIDFGTSTSLAAEGEAARGTTLAPLGRATTYMPTLLGVDGARLVAGDAAADLPERQIIRSIKRRITERVTAIPHPVDDGSVLDVDEGIVEVLRALGTSARQFFALDERSIRLGCPAMWDADQRNRLLGLARRSGIPVSEHTLIDEPIAAGMAWVSHRVRDFGERLRGRLLVFDMGGGTLDVALLQVDTSSGDHAGEISVLSSKGVNEAGDVLDHAIAADLLGEFATMGIHVEGAALTNLERRALLEARRAKVLLSSEDHAYVQLGTDAFEVPSFVYTREQLEAAFARQLAEAESLTWHVVRESFLTHELSETPSELRNLPDAQVARGVDHVLLAGGMSQVPAVRDLLESMFPHAEIHTRVGRRVAPDEAIVAGLAETTVYDRVNLHRPPFDFTLDLPGGRTEVLYQAHSPLYEGWEATQRSQLFYERVVDTTDLPLSGRVTLRATSAMGTEVTFRFGPEDTAGIDLPLGRRPICFRIHPSGYMLVVDGRGAPHRFRVNRWPVLRGRDHASIQIERLEAAPSQPDARPWEQEWANYVK